MPIVMYLTSNDHSHNHAHLDCPSALPTCHSPPSTGVTASVSSCKEFSECCATISSIAKANRAGSSRDRAGEGRGKTGGGRRQPEVQARQTNNTHEQQQPPTHSTVHSLQLLRCLGALPMHSARLFCRLFCARFFSWRGSVEGQGDHGSWLGRTPY